MKYIISALLLLIGVASIAAAQTNELTYQGRLVASGSAVNTPHDLEFRLCASEMDCVTPLEVKQRPGVPVSNGIFTVKLDFDAAHFNGADRWLEIAVRPAGSGAFATLSPRQRVASAPYSIKSLNAETAVTATNSTQLGGVAADQFVQTNDTRLSDDRNPLPNSVNYIQNGTTSQPNASFNIAGSGYIGRGLRIEGLGFFLPNTPSLSLSSSGIFQIDAPFQPSGRFVVLENGNVGIGNGAPTERLDVAGNIKFTGSISGDGAGLGAIKWQSVAGLAQQAQPNKGYIANNAAQVTITLPTAPGVGDTVRISGVGVGGWKVAQNAGQSIIGTNIGLIGTNWAPRENSREWQAVASSDDGNKLVAVVIAGQIYTSSNSGISWTAREGVRNWRSVASSADGSKLVAAVFGGQIYTSTNSGETWLAQASNRNWWSVASSSDGSKLAAVVSNGQIYTSTDSGINWTPRETTRTWRSIASSADGTKLVAVVTGGQIYTSTDSGVSWTAREANRSWNDVASSSDGTKLVAVESGGQIYTSTDSGVNWTARETNRSWTSVASSSDGTKLVAVTSTAQIYTSADSGIGWTPRENNRFWSSVASSSDGSVLVATDSLPGQIYISSAYTTLGTPGYLTGGKFSAIELQYIGNGQFLPLSHSGTMSGH